MQTYIGTISVTAQAMTRGEYYAYREVAVPSNEDPRDNGFLVEYLDGCKSWLPSGVFDRVYQAQIEVAEKSADDVVTEGMIQARGLNARRVSLDELHSSIKQVEIIRYTTPSGSVLRFAVLILDNGFCVTGRPSVAVSPENDDDEVGVKIAIQNAAHELWPILGFRAVEQKRNL